MESSSSGFGASGSSGGRTTPPLKRYRPQGLASQSPIEEVTSSITTAQGEKPPRKSSGPIDMFSRPHRMNMADFAAAYASSPGGAGGGFRVGSFAMGGKSPIESSSAAGAVSESPDSYGRKSSAQQQHQAGGAFGRLSTTPGTMTGALLSYMHVSWKKRVLLSIALF